MSVCFWIGFCFFGFIFVLFCFFFLNQKRMFDFVKCSFCFYWNDHIFVLFCFQSVNMVNYTDCFLSIKLTLHSGDFCGAFFFSLLCFFLVTADILNPLPVLNFPSSLLKLINICVFSSLLDSNQHKNFRNDAHICFLTYYLKIVLFFGYLILDC